jgi:hypothetical protein
MEIQIRRRESKSYLPPEVVADSKKILASIFVNQGPLRVDGSDELVAELLQIRITDIDFSKKVNEFWADLRLDVPMEGYTLNVAKTDNGKPVKIKDYLVYEWAKRHKLVAENRAEMENNPQKLFYIYNPEVETGTINKSVVMKRKAYSLFATISDDEYKMAHIIRLLSNTDPKNMNKVQKENFISDLIEADATKFLIVAQDKNLEIKSEIEELVSASVVSKIGNQYIYIEEKLGENIDEAVFYWNDKKNSQRVLEMKARLKEIRKTH